MQALLNSNVDSVRHAVGSIDTWRALALWRFFFLIGSKAHFQKKLFVNYGAISAT
jgi:hypothetical protein